MIHYHIDIWQDESVWSWKGAAKDDDDAFEQARLELNSDWDEEYETWDDLAADMNGTALLIDENATERANVAAYDAELDRLELVPDAFDYNAIMALLNGGALILPTGEERD